MYSGSAAVEPECELADSECGAVVSGADCGAGGGESVVLDSYSVFGSSECFGAVAVTEC